MGSARKDSKGPYLRVVASQIRKYSDKVAILHEVELLDHISHAGLVELGGRCADEAEVALPVHGLLADAAGARAGARVDHDIDVAGGVV